MRVTEFTNLDWRDPANHIKHLDVMAWDIERPGDVASVRMSHYNGLEYVETLDASRLGLTSEDVMVLFAGPFTENIRWLDLKGNRNVGEDAVRWLCYLIKNGYSKLEWIDLRGTAFDATPYFEMGFWGGTEEDLDYWRMPLRTRELAKEFGVQHWMTMGFPFEECGEIRRPAIMPPRYK